MSAPFFAVDSERWPRMLARLRTLGPLEEDEARTDLRWLENEHRVWTLTSGKRGACFPGRRALEVRWGWPERKVRAVLAADDWHDPISPVPAAELRRSAPAVPATAPQTSPQASPQASPSPNGPTSPIPEICPADVPATAPQTSPSMSIARAFLGTTLTTEPRERGHTASGGPPQVTQSPLLTTPKADPTPKPPRARASADTQFRRRVSDQFGEAFTEVFGARYPWVFAGKYHDGHRVNVWIEAAKIREADPEPGLARLRGAALAYCRNVEAGRVFPYDEKANTQRFTTGIVTWLQTDPNERPRPRPRTAAEERQRTLDGLDAAIAEAERQEREHRC